MAWTVDNSVHAAALDGITALLNNGDVRLLTSGDAELAVIGFGATAFGAGTSADPSVATANTMTADSSVTDGTVAKCEFRNSGATALLSGSVSTIAAGTGNLQLTDTVIPASAASVNFSSLTFSLSVGDA